MSYTPDEYLNPELYLVRYQSNTSNLDPETNHRQLLEVNHEFGVTWLRSYESSDGKTTFSVYEAPDERALEDQAVCLGLKICELIHVAEMLPPGRGRPAHQPGDPNH